MEITNINLKAVKGEDPVLAYCSIVIDDAICIRKIRIISKSEKFFICFPSLKNKTGEYADVVHPINRETRDKIEKLILNSYLAQLKTGV